MRLIDKIYIDGRFVTPHGTELFDLHNPATAQVIGRVRAATPGRLLLVYMILRQVTAALGLTALGGVLGWLTLGQRAPIAHEHADEYCCAIDAPPLRSLKTQP